MSTPNSHPTGQQYGPATLFAATVNMLLGTTIAWVSCPYPFLALYFGPMLVIDVLVAAVLISLRGLAQQVGRGLFIGLLSIPLSAATVWSSYLVGS
ncbi:hypothetical protein ACQ856_30185 (plasmid) [Mycolicibacterium psychrotolerans]|uniref:hypothetical protein n=1 Tax=Mycolicibacterium psychrotolerans TaxID=216929 RepID=UPI003D67B576